MASSSRPHLFALDCTRVQSQKLTRVALKYNTNQILEKPKGERKKERRTHFIIGILVDAPQALVHDEAFQILWMALELENLK